VQVVRVDESAVNVEECSLDLHRFSEPERDRGGKGLRPLRRSATPFEIF
jgi:hypothetical protein